MAHRMANPALAFLLLLVPAAGQSKDLGEVHFPTSGNAEAQERFIEGVLWLHSFEYPDAREAFQAAQEADPDFAMAYWGEAMTYNHPLWLRENAEAAREALEKLAPSEKERLAKAPTEREKDYLRAVHLLFSDKDKRTRDTEYAEFMADMRENYPDDLEAASFYALALLGTCHDGRHIPTYMKAAAVVEEVFLRNERHPGALHYLIHSYDDPVHAPLGLRAARRYAKIAPSAGHALHMPSHVFLALGMWDETVASNIDSFRAGEERMKRKGLSVAERNYHALSWLHYALLQQGRYREASEKLAIAEKDVRDNGAPHIRRYHAHMRAHQMLETRDWADPPPPARLGEDASPTAAAVDHFVNGWAAIRNGKLEEAEKRLAEMNAHREQAEKRGRGKSGDYNRVGAPRTRSAKVMALELEGLLHLAKGEEKAGLNVLRKAAEAEEELPAGYGPPTPVKPSRELLAEALLQAGRAGKAARQFEKALQRHPKRALSLLGLARAAAAAGDLDTASEARGQLSEVWSKSDEDVDAETELSGARD